MRVTSATYQPVEANDPTLQEILVALSFALDLTEGAVPGHAIRSCLLAARIAMAAGLSQDAISDLYYATLLKDVGCSSNAARMCQIVGGDDRAVKAGVKLVDWTRTVRPDFAMVKMLWHQVLPGASTWKKSGRMVKMAVKQHATNRELIDMRCDRGSVIVRKLGLGTRVAVGVRHLDEHWNGGGYPSGLKGHDIPVISRLMAVAQHLDAFCMAHGPQVAMDTLVERSGRWFDPELVAAAKDLDKSRRLWLNCLPSDPVEETRAAILQLNPERQTRLSALDIDAICETFADVVDAKSPFTYRHSIGVMDAAVAIGNVLGLAPERMRLLRRAALLHDVGKLSISNTILDKPTRLTDAEIAIVKVHPGLSAEILGHIAAFGEIAVIAGEHHEKLDGTGYPHGLRKEDLSLESRLLAVADIYGALSEQRPYREALVAAQIAAIMHCDVPAKLDPLCYEALRTVMADVTQVPYEFEEAEADRWCIPSFECAEAFI
ncbi:MAG TPA: HD domain-containing phosphohydrolase [Acidobacteriaceae bacterium]|nr:HD domain-containing phosphohydrolase [Acidobacteriaceae bacterium]